MNVLFYILTLVFSSLIFNILWDNTKVNRRFKKYRKNLINIKTKFKNLEINDLDDLSFTGATFLVSLVISLLPVCFAYFATQKLFSIQIISIISSGLVTIPVFYKIKK